MIRRLSHATIYCHDQDEGKSFYADKVGFEVKADEIQDGHYGSKQSSRTSPATGSA